MQRGKPELRNSAMLRADLLRKTVKRRFSAFRISSHVQEKPRKLETTALSEAMAEKAKNKT
jgi:hypothetical protein